MTLLLNEEKRLRASLFALSTEHQQVMKALWTYFLMSSPITKNKEVENSQRQVSTPMKQKNRCVKFPMGRSLPTTRALSKRARSTARHGGDEIKIAAEAIEDLEK